MSCDFELTEDQKFIFQEYVDGHNIFLTGPGGCGKSFIIKLIVKHALQHNKNIKVCAMTGCAAVLLGCGAKTLHSWAGIGLAKGDENSIITKIAMNKYKSKNWINTKILIIDEISMMSKQLFNLLDAIGKRIRKNSRPFGGIQLIFSGDFYQLPPVGNQNDPDTNKFCFESEHWEETFETQILLDKIFRQTNEEYVNVLHQIREGMIFKRGYELLKNRLFTSEELNNYPFENGVKPIILHPTKKTVNQINHSAMEQLDSEIISFKYKFGMREIPKESIQKIKMPTKTQMEIEEQFLISNSLFEPVLNLKIGSQVMCIANVDMDLNICNGTTGIITDFKGGFPYVKLTNGSHYLFTPHTWNSENIPVCIQQIPLILAWAVTIHKSQGATLDMAQVNLGSSVFTYGQSYVALSRVKSLEGLFLTSFNPQKIKADPNVKIFYERFYDVQEELEEQEQEQEQDVQIDKPSETINTEIKQDIP